MKRPRRHAYYASESCNSTYFVACAYGYYWLQNCIKFHKIVMDPYFGLRDAKNGV